MLKLKRLKALVWMVSILTINRVIKLVTFIPWILYYIEIMYYRIHMIERCDLNKAKYFNYVNKNFFKAINIKELVLFFVFIIFTRYENTVALEILFPTVYLYLLVDFFHTYANDCGKINYYILMVLSVMLLIFVIMFFIITNHLYTTYDFMFIISILSTFIIYIMSLTIKEK